MKCACFSMAFACVCGVHGKGKSVPAGKSRHEYRHGSRSTAALSPQELQIRRQPKSSPPLTSPYALLLSEKKPPEFPKPSHPLGESEAPATHQKKKKKSRSNNVALGITQSRPPRSTLLWPACLSTKKLLIPNEDREAEECQTGVTDLRQ